MKFLIALFIITAVIGSTIFIFKSKWLDRKLKSLFSSGPETPDDVESEIYNARKSLEEIERDAVEQAKNLKSKLDKTKTIKKTFRS